MFSSRRRRRRRQTTPFCLSHRITCFVKCHNIEATTTAKATAWRSARGDDGSGCLFSWNYDVAVVVNTAIRSTPLMYDFCATTIIIVAIREAAYFQKNWASHNTKRNSSNKMFYQTYTPTQFIAFSHASLIIPAKNLIQNHSYFYLLSRLLTRVSLITATAEMTRPIFSTTQKLPSIPFLI